MWEKRSRRIFIFCSVIASVLILQMAVYLHHLFWGGTAVHNLFQVCHLAIQSIGLAWMDVVLNALLIQTVFLLFWFLGRQLFASAVFSHRLHLYKDKRLSEELNRLFAGGRPVFVVIHSPGPIAMSAGIIRRRIVLSTGLLEMLDHDERDAVIQHELCHHHNRDPLKTFVLGLFAGIMWYLPVLKVGYNQYKVVREVIADKYAIGKTGATAGLESALLKLLQARAALTATCSHVSFADNAINFRIRQLIEPQAVLPPDIPVFPMILSGQVLAVLCVMFGIVL
ncbi:M56 family metallopeptidase [Paenibacillus larvae]|uniref:M56 family metallopeptidase n=1 Tax=Paenibacillus larvae TaxID=1464 RepID=UPI00227FF2F7|nr:M56 family metallopeptidase [Paenibacillus larvae]MCY9509994.1 M56 family metallopeptidase [Paenibacillus larvae]MCY9524731.1 M56 family metallopeptidase [Paenibacillus larvae]